MEQQQCSNCRFGRQFEDERICDDGTIVECMLNLPTLCERGDEKVDVLDPSFWRRPAVWSWDFCINWQPRPDAIAQVAS